MTVAAKREKLHDLINAMDDEKIEVILSLIEQMLYNDFEPTNRSVEYEKMVLMQHAASDSLFLEDLKETGRDFSQF